jgi:hypothetical protein
MDADPDPEHWFREPLFFQLSTVPMESGPSNQSSGFGRFIILLSENLETIFGLKYFNSSMRIRIRDPLIFLTLDPGSEMKKIRIRDGKNSDPGFEINN